MENLHKVPGAWQIQVGTKTERVSVKVSEKPHPHPLVEGMLAVYEDVDRTSWIVEMDVSGLEYTPIIEVPDKAGAIIELDALIKELTDARDLLRSLPS